MKNETLWMYRNYRSQLAIFLSEGLHEHFRVGRSAMLGLTLTNNQRLKIQEELKRIDSVIKVLEIALNQ